MDLYAPAEEQTGIQEDICKLLSLTSISHSSSRTVAQGGKMDPARCGSSTRWADYLQRLDRDAGKGKRQREGFIFGPHFLFVEHHIAVPWWSQEGRHCCVSENLKKYYHWLTVVFLSCISISFYIYIYHLQFRVLRLSLTV